MRALVQRVIHAKVTVADEVIGSIANGLLLFLAIHKSDSPVEADKLSRRVLHSRLFPDSEGKMNRSLLDIEGELLLVSQFTLYGDTTKGNRPSYSEAAGSDAARQLYDYFVACCASSSVRVQTGRFQAQMQVHLVNDGPVTLLFETKCKNVL